jgi:hypothetical protein
LFLAISSNAGIFGSKPTQSFKSKLMTIPMLNNGQPIDLTVDEFEKYGFREDAKLSWDSEGKSAWIFEIKLKDKMKGSTDTIKLRFQDEPKTARLDRIVVNGKEENVNYSPQLLGAIIAGAEQKRGPSKRKVDLKQAKETKTEISILNKIQGQYCNSLGNRIDIKPGNSSDALITLSEAGCSMSQKSLPAKIVDDGVELALDESSREGNVCTMTLTPRIEDQNKISVAVNCRFELAHKIMGCSVGNMNLTFAKCAN